MIEATDFKEKVQLSPKVFHAAFRLIAIGDDLEYGTECGLMRQTMDTMVHDVCVSRGIQEAKQGRLAFSEINKQIYR